jgi:phosphoribosyl 1,2-cyclic phosphodiesterase
MGFSVTFWGTRGSIPTPGASTQKFGGDTSCVELRVGDTVLICDAGTGLRKLGVELMRRSSPLVAHLFLSHPHWDHIQGFPFFAPVYTPTTLLHVHCVADGQERLRDLLSGQMEGDYFPVQFSDLGARIEQQDLVPGPNQVDGVTVRAMRLEHPGTSLGFAFEHEGAKVVYATDNEIDLTFPDPDQVQKDLEAPRPVPEALVDFVRGADLLIADGQYTDEEYPQKIGWGHARATTLVDLAVRAAVKQLAIFHHDPMQSDELVEAKVETCLARAKRLGGKLEIFGAREGFELRID